MILAFLFSIYPSFAAVPDPSPQSYQFSYQVEIQKPKHAFKTLAIWIPMPSTNFEQEIISEEITGITGLQMNVEKKQGNRMMYFALTDKNFFPVKIEVKYKIKRSKSYTTKLSEIKDANYWDPRLYLSSDKKIPLTGQISKIAANVTAGLTDNDAKIKKIYEYVVGSMEYNKSGTGWGEGDAIWACNNKRGNCTDFHSLLIGMARSEKIPAKFEIGFPIPDSGEGDIPGYHCWARMYSEKLGWVPVDASESKKAHDLFKYYGVLPNNRIQFTNGRDIDLEPKQKGPPLNYFIFPYLELDGVKYDKFATHYHVTMTAPL